MQTLYPPRLNHPPHSRATTPSPTGDPINHNHFLLRPRPRINNLFSPCKNNRCPAGTRHASSHRVGRTPPKGTSQGHFAPVRARGAAVGSRGSSAPSGKSRSSSPPGFCESGLLCGVARPILASLACCCSRLCFLHLMRRFWNQTFTWGGDGARCPNLPAPSTSGQKQCPPALNSFLDPTHLPLSARALYGLPLSSIRLPPSAWAPHSSP